MKKIFLALIISFAFAVCSFGSTYFQQGVSLFNKKNYQAARATFSKAIDINNYDLNSRYYYAVCCVRLGEKEMAISEFHTIIRMDPDSYAASMSKKALISLDPNGFYRPVNSSSSQYDSYINNAVTSNGMYVRWDRTKPIRVYVDPANTTIENTNEVKQAVKQWAKALKGTADVILVYSKQSADIVVVFSRKTFEITKTHHTLGTTLPQYTSNRLLRLSKVELSTMSPSGKVYSPVFIYNTALHELGHALGIWGHSQNKSDIMYAYADENYRRSLSARDIRTIKLLYQNPANITNTSNTSANVATKLNKKRINTKVEEALNYLKKNPTSVNAHKHLGSVYMGMGDYDNAIIVYKRVIILNPKDDQSYFILGYLYFKKKDTQNAIVYYKKAVDLKPAKVEYTVVLVERYISAKRYNEARAALENLYRLNPDAKKNPMIARFQVFLDFATIFKK